MRSGREAGIGEARAKGRMKRVARRRVDVG